MFFSTTTGKKNSSSTPRACRDRSRLHAALLLLFVAGLVRLSVVGDFGEGVDECASWSRSRSNAATAT